MITFELPKHTFEKESWKIGKWNDAEIGGGCGGENGKSKTHKLKAWCTQTKRQSNWIVAVWSQRGQGTVKHRPETIDGNFIPRNIIVRLVLLMFVHLQFYDQSGNLIAWCLNTSNNGGCRNAWPKQGKSRVAWMFVVVAKKTMFRALSFTPRRYQLFEPRALSTHAKSEYSVGLCAFFTWWAHWSSVSSTMHFNVAVIIGNIIIIYGVMEREHLQNACLRPWSRLSHTSPVFEKELNLQFFYEKLVFWTTPHICRKVSQELSMSFSIAPRWFIFCEPDSRNVRPGNSFAIVTLWKHNWSYDRGSPLSDIFLLAYLEIIMEWPIAIQLCTRVQ